MKQLVIAPQERIDDFEPSAREFVRAAIAVDYGGYQTVVRHRNIEKEAGRNSQPRLIRQQADEVQH